MSTLRKMFRLSSLIVVSAVAGCATGVPNLAMDSSARAQTHTVRINPVVAMPPEISFLGQSQSVAGLVAGPFAALMDGKLSAEPKRRLTEEIRDAHIDVPAMLTSAFATKVAADAGLKAVSQGEPADAQVDLVIDRYGFSIAHPGTSTLFPVYGVSAIMKDAKGQVIWQGSDVMSAHFADNKDGHTLEELEKDPELVRRALSAGSELVARMLVRNFKGEEVVQNIPGIQK
jgi:hypothetical protein